MNRQHSIYRICKHSYATRMAGKDHMIRSSLPFQILLYLNGWYFAFFWIIEILVFAYKGDVLPYPKGVLVAEIALIIVFAGLEAIRMFFGSKGNLTERIMPVVISLVMSVPSIFALLYLMLWQTYVLRVEFIIATIQLVFIGLQSVFAVISVITFARAAPF